MTTIHTAYGDGRIVDSKTERGGRNSYKVAGPGFELWMREADVRSAVEPSNTTDTFEPYKMLNEVADYMGSHVQGTPGHNPISSGGHTGNDAWGITGSERHASGAFTVEPSNHTWDNSTTLPYDWKGRADKNPTDMYDHEQTMSPDHETLDWEDVTDSTDSRSGESREDEHNGPGPAPHLFAGSRHPGHPDSWPFEPGPADYEEWDRNHPEHQPAYGTDAYHEKHAWAPPENPEHDPDFDDFEEAGHHPDRYQVNGSDDYRPHHREAWTFHDEDPDQGAGHWDAATEHLQHENHEHGWDRPAGLDERYASIPHEAADHFNNPVVRFQDDPHREIHRTGSIDISAGLDRETGEWMDLCKADKQIRTAAWRDVASKAKRIKNDGGVHIHAMDPSAIYASVEGDHGTYDVMILRGSAYSGVSPVKGKQAIANWKCSCDWGKWAFKRKFTYVGRLCSHGYATYLTQQAHYMKDKHQKSVRQKAAGLDEFKTWCKKENGDHIDQDAADTYLSQPDAEITRDDAEKILQYVLDHHTEHPDREYDVKGYHYDNDSVLQHQPGKLTPHLFQVPEGEEAHFTDLGDDRKTTGPGQIMAKTAKGDGHHPAFAWHNDDEPDFPKDGIVHFSALHLVADENLLQKMRDFADEPYEPRRMDEHNKEVSQVMDELHERGFAASPLVAMRQAALWRTADGQDDRLNRMQHNSDAATGGSSSPPPGQPGQLTRGDRIQQNMNNPAITGDSNDGGAADLAQERAEAQDTLRARTNNPNATLPANAGPGHAEPSPPVGPGGAPQPAPSTMSDVTHGGGGGGTPAQPMGGGATPITPGAGGSSAPGAVTETHPGSHDTVAPATPGGGTGSAQGNGPGYGGSGFQGGGGTSGTWLPSTETNHIGPGAYTVKPGDTMSGIADRAGVGLNTLQSPTGNMDLIHPGETVNVGAGSAPKAPSGAGGTTPAAPSASSSAPAASGVPGLPTPAVGSAGRGPAASVHGAARFAQLYFQAADDEGGEDSGGDDKNNKSVGPAPGVGGDTTHPGGSVTPATTNQGPNYKQISTGDPQQPRPGANPSLPGGASETVHAPPAGTPGAQTSTSTSGAPGQPQQQKQQQQGQPGQQPGGGMGSEGLQQAMSVAAPLIGELGTLPGELMGGLGGGGLGGLAGGLGGALSGLTHMFHGSNDAQRYAARYFQGAGNFLGEGGGDWMDYSFAGSGPDRQYWSTTSEDYVEQNEKTNRHDTWTIDNDGDITHYTKTRPKQSAVRRQADMLSGDAGFGGGPGPETGGATLSPGGSGMGLGGSTTEPASGGAQDAGALFNASLSESSRQFWADAFSPEETGYFNYRNPQPRHHHSPHQQQPDQAPGGAPGGGPEEEAAPEAAEGADAVAADALPAAMAVVSRKYDNETDVVRAFQASMGKDFLAGSDSGQFSDDAIAKQAQRMLRTAGRKFTPAEERALEEESHHLGARNLGDLDLTGTHYVED